MNILAFSGLHGNQPLIKTLIQSINRKRLTPDLIISAGDVGDSIFLELFIEMSRFEVPVLFVGGNWESDPKVLKSASEISGVYHISNDGYSYDDFYFLGQDAWTDNVDDKTIDNDRFVDLQSKWEKVKPNNLVLVTHHPPLGILDRGFRDPRYFWNDKYGQVHGGSMGIRRFVEKYCPDLHIFAHLHYDGCKWVSTDRTLFTNVSYVSRKTKNGILGMNGSFMMINTDTMISIPHHLNTVKSKKCECGSIHFLNYRKCTNCYDTGVGYLPYSELTI